VFVYEVTHPAATFIWLAAVLGGFALAWVHWRRRNMPPSNLVPAVNPAEFGVLMAGMLIAVVASAPIVAAAGFCYWFLDVF
jgi:hypothetical protein